MAFSYPLFIGFVEPSPVPNYFRSRFLPGFRAPGPTGLSSPVADVFMLVAYTVFLYLSLE